MIHQDPKTDYLLAPLYKDAFSLPFGNAWFERDKKNRVTHLRIYTGRARNVEFRKITE